MGKAEGYSRTRRVGTQHVPFIFTMSNETDLWLIALIYVCYYIKMHFWPAPIRSLAVI